MLESDPRLLRGRSGGGEGDVVGLNQSRACEDQAGTSALVALLSWYRGRVLRKGGKGWSLRLV